MDMLQHLNAAMAWMEENLCAEFRLEEAARVACLSEDSFARFFSYMTGMSLKEYVRRRRLSRAAEELQRGESKVIDVAMEYGYASADAFSRAFFRQHGITPSQCKKGEGSLKIYPPVSFHISIKGANEMDFRLVNMEGMHVYGLSKAQVPGESREAVRHSMWDEKEENVPGRICAGQWNMPGNTAYDGVWYGLWREGRYMIGRSADDAQGDGLEQQEIPAGMYAVFITKKGENAWEAIPALWTEIFDSWLPSSGYRLRSGDVVEAYHLWTDHDRRKKERYYEIRIPVEKK